MDTIDRKYQAEIVLIEAPPRHGKSEYCSRWLPSWFIGQYPHKHVILNSYHADPARMWGKRTKEVIIEHGKPYFGVSISADSSSNRDWEIAQRGGGLLTSGVGGPITGRGADLLIIDDPLKNAEQAVSGRIRESIWQWWISTAYPRLEPGATIVIVQTRWHKEDLAGRIWQESLDGNYDTIKLSMPAIALEDDVLGREVGEPLWPDRWPIETLRKKERSLDTYWWNSLYQQRPGNYEKSEWPDRYFDNVLSDYWPDTFESGVVALDPALGTTARGDYSAIVYVGMSGGLLYVDCVLKRTPVSETISNTLDMWLEYNADRVGTEANAFQQLLGIEFNRQQVEKHLPTPPLFEIVNTGNKGIRIRRIGPFLEQKRLRFRNNPACRMLLDQLKEFPIAVHDDGPDALEMAIRLLHDNQLDKSDRISEELTIVGTSL